MNRTTCERDDAVSKRPRLLRVGNFRIDCCGRKTPDGLTKPNPDLIKASAGGHKTSTPTLSYTRKRARYLSYSSDYNKLLAWLRIDLRTQRFTYRRFPIGNNNKTLKRPSFSMPLEPTFTVVR